MAITQTNTLTIVSKDASSNTAVVRYVVQLTTSGQTYDENNGRYCNYTIDGTSGRGSDVKLPHNSTVTVLDVTQTISNASGKTVNANFSFYTYTSAGTVTGNTSVYIDLPRYATCSQSLNSKTSSSIKMNWSSDSTIDYVWYSIDNGSNWVAVGSVNASSGSYNVTGLSANTSYNIKTRVRRKDSQLTTDSSVLGVKTYNKTSATISLSSKTINSIIVTSACNVTVLSTQYRIKTASGSYGSYQTSSTFSNLSPNTSYTIETKKVASESGEVGYAYIDVVTYDYARISANNFNHGDDVLVSFSNPSGCEVALCIVDKQTDDVICGYRNASGNSYIFVFSDDELDNMYKKFGNENSRIVRIYVRTYCNETYYYDYKEVIVSLTGNQKTIHIYIDGLKSGKTFIGYNGEVRRGVWWIGDKDKVPRRCI